MKTHYLSVCAIFKDEASYLEEWIRFHLAQGVEHLYLYDNNSADSGSVIVDPFVRTGKVTLIPWPTLEENAGQRKAYMHCLETYGADSQWIAFIDIDEFLFGVNEPLPELLREYEAHPALYVHWQTFGSSGHIARPPGSVIENFIRRAPTNWARNRQGKSIVNPETVASPHKHDKLHQFLPHQLDYRGGQRAVQEDHVVVPSRERGLAGFWIRIKKLLGAKRFIIGGRFPMLFDPYNGRAGKPSRVRVNRIRINHYITKSREEYDLKVKRFAARSYKYTLDFFRFHDRNEIVDVLLRDKVK